MNRTAWRRHRLVNTLQSTLLLAAMAAILALLGWTLGGGTGVLWALGAGVLMIVLMPGVSPRIVLRMYGASALGPRQLPQLHAMLGLLAERAELPRTPQLYCLPSGMMNAFAVGSRSNAAIAVTDALLRRLTPRELAAVIAHEVSHIRNNDMWVMSLADLFSRMTSVFSFVGQLLLLVNLPLMLFTEQHVSWLAVLVLIFAPAVSALVQLALSRTREYDADLGAAELTGDPRGMALALEKMERLQGRLFEQIVFPGRRVPDPSLLRTHPPTDERIERLLELAPAARPLGVPLEQLMLACTHYPRVTRSPRWHLHGVRY